MATLDDLMSSFKNAKTASATADKFYEEKKSEWLEVSTAYQEFKGPSKAQSILNMLAPMAAKMGWKLPLGGGIGALLTGFSANEGGFSGITGFLSGLISKIPFFGSLFG